MPQFKLIYFLLGIMYLLLCTVDVVLLVKTQLVSFDFHGRTPKMEQSFKILIRQMKTTVDFDRLTVNNARTSSLFHDTFDL